MKTKDKLVRPRSYALPMKLSLYEIGVITGALREQFTDLDDHDAKIVRTFCEGLGKVYDAGMKIERGRR